MKKKMINMVHLEGRLYSHNLEKKVSGETSKNPNTEYIRGTIDVATDPECTNVISVHYTYVTPTYGSGKSNSNYKILESIAEGTTPTMTSPEKADKAPYLRIDTNLDLNDFYTDSNGELELVSIKRNEGGFIHVIHESEYDPKESNRFKVDMVITDVKHQDANDEKNIPERAIVKGCIFNFRNAILPMEFSVTSQGGMGYFEGLGASSTTPVFTNVWGQQVATTVTRTLEEESAFGDSYIREVNSTRRDFIITGSLKVPYEWDDENSITAVELKELSAERETYLATLKQRRDEYSAQTSAPAPTPTAVKSSDFNF